MPRTENEDWLLYQTFDDGTQDSGFKAFRAGLDIMEKKFTSYNKQSTPCSRCGELNNSLALYCQWCGFTGRE